eukprot:6128534-Amphidinium_carterae.1
MTDEHQVVLKIWAKGHNIIEGPLHANIPFYKCIHLHSRQQQSKQCIWVALCRMDAKRKPFRMFFVMTEAQLSSTVKIS